MGEDKMQKMGLYSFLILLLTVVRAFASPLNSYQELAAALSVGERLVILVNFEECIGKSGPIGYFIPSKMMLVPASATSPERIVTSDLHFTDYAGNPIYEYTKYTFCPDESVVLRTVNYDPITFKPVGNAHVIHCTLGKGISIRSN